MSSTLKTWLRFGLTWRLSSRRPGWRLFPTTSGMLLTANSKLINGVLLVLFTFPCRSFICGVLLTTTILAQLVAEKFWKWRCAWYQQLSSPHLTLFLPLMLTPTWRIWLTTSTVSRHYFPNTNCIRTITWPFTFMNISCCLGQSILGGLFLLNGWLAHSSVCHTTINPVSYLLFRWNGANVFLKENLKKRLLVLIPDQQIFVQYYRKLGVLTPYSTASLSFASLSSPNCVIASRRIFKFWQHLLRTRMNLNRWQPPSRCTYSQ